MYYFKSLEEDLKSEINGYFLTGVLALIEPIDEYEAKCIRKAIKGLGTDEQVCIQTLCPKEAHEIEILKSAYERCKI
jgi:annexin A7/11